MDWFDDLKQVGFFNEVTLFVLIFARINFRATGLTCNFARIYFRAS